jgi:16S rRNA (adenine1518-N6/adenine1519-N6)-dimethyltransferase
VLTRTRLRELSDRHGLTPSRALGQNFVVDPNTVRRIARLAAVGSGDHVVEIGAGLGSLTLALVETGAKVTTVETDRHLLPALEEVLEGQDVRLVVGDALELDWHETLAGAGPWTLVANLPYNVATPLILDLLDEVPEIAQMLVMVQLEAAERLAAVPGTKAFGLPSLKVRHWAETGIVGHVSPEVFSPRPNVESALLSISRRPEPGVPGPVERWYSLARTAFGQRRKMVRKSLAGVVDQAAFDRADVDPATRPEQLDVAYWGRLADEMTP